jgi:hypothetical protein
MNRTFIFFIFLISSFLATKNLYSAEDFIIARIKQNLPTLTKVQHKAKIYNCRVTIPGKGAGKITKADVVYQLDRKGDFSALLELENNTPLDVTSCVSKEDKDNFYKKLLKKAEKDKKSGEPELDNFLKLAIDETTRFFLE